MADPRLAARTREVEPFHVMVISAKVFELMAQGRDVIVMVAGEPDFGTPPAAVEAATKAIANGKVRYTASPGIDPLRSAIAGYYGERFDVDLPASRVMVTTGASSALLLALAAIVERDAEVLLADPGYPCNRHFARIYEGRAVNLPVGSETNYQLSADLVEANWSYRTTGVLLATPSNPTGTIVRPAELAAIADVVAERRGTLFVDEIYGELVYDLAPQTVLSHTNDAFVINSFSKTFGMTGWRLGWLVVPEWALDAVDRLAQNMYISAPAASQAAGLACFSPEVWAIVAERREQFRERRDVLIAGLRDIGFKVPVVPEGAFYVYADCSAFTDDSYRFCLDLLEHAGVGCTPGIDFGTYLADRHIRFSYTCSPARIVEALARIWEFVGR